MRLRSILGLALAITVAQVSVTAMISGSRAPGEAYLKLLNWDSWHYESIASKGYSYPADGHVVSDDIHAGRANVVFFPGYPLAAHLTHEATGIPVKVCLLLVAHLSAVLVWIYFLLLLARSGISSGGIRGAVVAAVAYPSAFFMVTGYTESLFLAASLGFIYWSDRYIECTRKGAVQSRLARSGAWSAALIHGWVLALTRIVGFAAAAYPGFRDFLKGKGVRRIRLASVALFVLSILASIGFFVYCQSKFGDWAVYFKLERIGWQNRPEYFAILNPLTYVPHFFFEDTIDSISRSSVTLGGALFAAWAAVEWRIFSRTRTYPERRIARSLVAFAMFYIAVTGKANSHLDSMLRYTLPVYFILLLNFSELNALRAKEGLGSIFFSSSRSGQHGAWKLACALVLGLGVQIWCIYRFTHGHWVA